MSFTDQQVLLNYIITRINDLHESLDDQFIDTRLADYYRGRIAELKDSLTE